MGQGDILARGGKRSTFGPAHVSQAQWDEIWKPEKPVEVTASPEPDAEQERENQKQN